MLPLLICSPFLQNKITALYWKGKVKTYTHNKGQYIYKGHQCFFRMTLVFLQTVCIYLIFFKFLLSNMDLRFSPPPPPLLPTFLFGKNWIRLSDWCCSYQRCKFESSRGRPKILSAQKYNSNTVGFNFQTYTYNAYIYLYYLIYCLYYINLTVKISYWILIMFNFIICFTVLLIRVKNVLRCQKRSATQDWCCWKDFQNAYDVR